MIAKKMLPKFVEIEYTKSFGFFWVGMRKNNVSKNVGFTMVELIVVTAILAILVMMAFPLTNEYFKSTKINVCVSDLRTIDRAISAYILDKNVLPSTLNDVGMGNMLDPWKRTYEYKREAVLVDISGTELNTDYDLYSTGEDGQVSEEDDIVRAGDGNYVGVR